MPSFDPRTVPWTHHGFHHGSSLYKLNLKMIQFSLRFTIGVLFVKIAINRISGSNQNLGPDLQASRYQWKTIAAIALTAVAIAAIAYYTHQYLHSPSNLPLGDSPTGHCLAVDLQNLKGHPCEGSLRDLQIRVNELYPWHSLKVVPPIPNSTFPISTTQAASWIAAQCTENERSAAERLVQNITHVDQTHFETALSQSVTKFNAWHAANGFSNYTLAITKASDQKSNRWVAELGLRHFKILPTTIMESEFGDGIVPEEEFGLKNAVRVVFDDAAYSCNQLMHLLRSHIRSRLQDVPNKHFNMVAIVPFMRDPHCLDLNFLLRDSEFGFRFATMNVFTAERMASVDQLLDSSDLDTLVNYGLELQDAKTLTYFDHKVPDWVSFPGHITHGSVCCSQDTGLYCDIRPRSRFIPEIIPPYKKVARQR